MGAMETSSVVQARGITKNVEGCCDDPIGNAAADEPWLVAQAKSGQAGAFRALYERHSSKIYRSAFRILRNQQDAKDAVQRSFQRAFTNLVRFREDSSFSTWMTRIAINEALMPLRQRRLDKVVSEEEDEGSDAHRALVPTDKQPTPEQALAKKEIHGAIVRAILKLRPTLQVVVVLREMRGLTNEETARHLGLTVSAVKARTYHANRHLRRHLERKNGGDRVAVPKRSCKHGR